MSTIPSGKAAKVAYLLSRIAQWQANAVAIGTTSAACTALGTLITTAQTKLADQLQAEEDAKTATGASNAAVTTMATAAADIIQAIRAKAVNSADPAAIYELAGIPAPSTPTPVSTLGTPTDWTVTLGQDGSVTVGWKCANPRATGTIYQVWRQLQGESDFSYLGGTGEKKFTDDSVPAGSQQTLYKVQAVRSTAKGPFAVCTVLFGKNTSTGAMTAKVVPTALAA